MTTQSEAMLEEELIAKLVGMDYERAYIKDEKELYSNFKMQLERLNAKELQRFGRTTLTDEEFEKVCLHLNGGSRFEKSKRLRDMFSIELENGEHLWLKFLEKTNWCKNIFQVANQISRRGKKNCRYDVTILVNGLPLLQIELKKRGIALRKAFEEIEYYHKVSYGELFDYVQIFVISNGVDTRYFANNPNCGFKFTFNWTDKANVKFNKLDLFASEFLSKCLVGKFLAKYVVMHEGSKSLMVLRPYQYYAVEAILDCVKNTGKNGYIWHTTGSGKTLTSFKAAQLIGEIDDVDKVLFVVDRHDLDSQTKLEYEAFEPGAVDDTDNTYELMKRLTDPNNKITLTTIQKLNVAVTKDFYMGKLEELRDKKVVMIFDECHRGHFGLCHKNITKFFNNLQIFGFTGTPIFPENAKNDVTTADVFDKSLHNYLIKDAIADNNVLAFNVEYYNGSNVENYESDKRMEEIVKFIFENHQKSTMQGEFEALFAVSSIPVLMKYYRIFKKIKAQGTFENSKGEEVKVPDIRIGAIFSKRIDYGYSENENTGMPGSGNTSEVNDNSDDMKEIMDDYNTMFHTSFTPENFTSYYDDVSLRMKRLPEKAMEPLDLLIVVGMMLTGFDAKKLNTLYVDKNLEYHNLIQAFSRTNRVLNEKKQFGQIMCMRDLKEKVDEAVKLFSEGHDCETVLRKPFSELKAELVELSRAFKEKYPDVESVDQIQGERAKVEFVIAFREILKKQTEIQVYNDFEPDDPDLPIQEQEYLDFKSKYLDIAMEVKCQKQKIEQEAVRAAAEEEVPYGEPLTLEDVDFCLELLHSDTINVDYILMLIGKLDPMSGTYQTERKKIIDTLNQDASLRGKSKLIDRFIKEVIDANPLEYIHLQETGQLNLKERMNAFVDLERQHQLEQMSEDEDIPFDTLLAYISEWNFLHREKTELLDAVLKERKLGLIAKRKKREQLVMQLRDIIDTYNLEE
ncbi:MAG: type I restriction endonuclease subunit R [Paludibacteraceae bacterium]|nr:type I restriction endonuclease subunit R [Paludibacteraceae bacterium]